MVICVELPRKCTVNSRAGGGPAARGQAGAHTVQAHCAPSSVFELMPEFWLVFSVDKL